MKLPISQGKLVEICQKNDIVALGVFGSFARGDFGPKSDVDFLVEFSKEKPKSFLDLVGAQLDFEDAIGRKVDLLTEGSISPYLIDRVKSEVQYIYKI